MVDCCRAVGLTDVGEENEGREIAADWNRTRTKSDPTKHGKAQSVCWASRKNPRLSGPDCASPYEE